MQRPWEIMMNFQRRLRPAGDSCEENGNNTIQLSAAAQRLLPGHNIHPTTRARRVQNIVDESARIVEESRLPALNNTVGSFCRNCSCDNCSNQTILNDTTLNQSNINTIVQSFEKFFEAQKQQFMMMIQQAANLSFQQGGDTSITNVHSMQQSLCNLLGSNTTCMQPVISEQGPPKTTKSKETTNTYQEDSRRIEAAEVPRLCAQSSTSGSQCSSPRSTVDEIEELPDSTVIPGKDGYTEDLSNVEECGQVGPLPITHPSNGEEDTDTELMSSDKSESSENSKDQTQKQCTDHSEEASFASFDGFVDDSFRPVRKSSIIKMRESFVVLKKLSPVKDTLPNDKQVKSNNTKNDAQSELSKKSIFKVPQELENNKKAVVPTADVPCTRSGRTVKKPQAYWVSSSRSDTKEEVSDTSKGKAPPQRRVGESGNRRIRPNQNIQKNSKENNLKQSCKNIRQQTQDFERLPTSSGHQNDPVVSSSTDSLKVPSNTGSKRGRKKKHESDTDSSHAPKSRRIKKMKMENQPSGASSNEIENKPDPRVAVKHQYKNRSKRNNNKELQNKSGDVSSNNDRRANQRGRVTKESVNLKKGRSRILSPKGRDNITLQIKNQNLSRFPSLSGNSTEPEYECYFDGQLSD